MQDGIVFKTGCNKCELFSGCCAECERFEECKNNEAACYALSHCEYVKALSDRTMHYRQKKDYMRNTPYKIGVAS